MTNDNRVGAGVPAGGQFAAQSRSDSAVALLPAPLASASDVQAFIDDEFRNHADFARESERRGESIQPPTWGSAVDSLTQMPADVLGAIVKGAPDDFARAFRARAEREGLDTDLPYIAVRESDSELLGAGYEQTIAKHLIDQRLEERDEPGHFSRADYAEVGENGIAYGLRFNPMEFGVIVAGERFDDESDDQYMDRVYLAEPQYWAKLGEFYRDVYGAELVEDGGFEDLVEFFVEYEIGGASASTIEYMGDRVEQETKLLQCKNDWDYGSVATDEFARRLGYNCHWDSITGSAYWVKNED